MAYLEVSIKRNRGLERLLGPRVQDLLLGIEIPDPAIRIVSVLHPELSEEGAQIEEVILRQVLQRVVVTFDTLHPAAEKDSAHGGGCLVNLEIVRPLDHGANRRLVSRNFPVLAQI